MHQLTSNKTYLLLDVRLESGYHYEEGAVVATETVVCNLQIDNGIITKILDTTDSYNYALDCYDAKGMLLLPAFREMHIDELTSTIRKNSY